MLKYQCHQCDMSVEGLNCGKCQEPLVHDHILVDGQEVAVSKCVKCDGMIKSPQCCGADMKPRSTS